MPLKLEDYVTTDQSVHNSGRAIRKMKTGALEKKIVSEHKSILEALGRLKRPQDSMIDISGKILGHLGNLHYKEFDGLERKLNDLLTGINESRRYIAEEIEKNSFNSGYYKARQRMLEAVEKVKTPTTLSESRKTLARFAEKAWIDYNSKKRESKKRASMPLPLPLISGTAHDVRKEARYFEKRAKELEKVEKDIEKLFARSNSYTLIWRFTTLLSETKIGKLLKMRTIEGIANKGEKIVDKIISADKALLHDSERTPKIPISLDKVSSREETLGKHYYIFETSGLASNEAECKVVNGKAVDPYKAFVELLRRQDPVRSPKEIKDAYRK
ncbi:MAG: hypothetical protein QXZ38_01305 [Candidatus Micrarchaeaceae archaeon]